VTGKNQREREGQLKRMMKGEYDQSAFYICKKTAP
jgi:hypothetical protein